jgi:hypothetical protein
MRKVYRFLGLKVWEVETDDTPTPDPELDETVEYAPDSPYALGATTERATERPPVFGFTTDFWYEPEDKGRNH